METFYLLIVVFLLVLAVFDLFVGVSNDAVNFLNSAIGAKVAKFKTVMFVASFGVVIGAMMSAGMMDVARHGIMQPENYSFHEVMTIFLAVMVTDVIVLDMFNTLGLPTSTTVSLVFELLGGTFILALLKMNADGSLTFDQLLNSDKALSVIIAIFVSVAIAFFFGVIVQWIARVVFTFSYNRHLKYTIAVFGGIAFTIMAYFIFIKGLSKSPFIEDTTKDWIKANTPMLMGVTFVLSTILMEIIHLLKVNVFKLIVMMGTFALAMAFAGNDLVNFIGVPMAGLDSYIDFTTNGSGNDDAFMMTSLMSSAKTPILYLMIAGGIMIFAMVTSKKAQNVVKTSVDLSRQDEGDEMFGSSRAARSIVRGSQDAGEFVTKVVPAGCFKWLDTRFRKEDAILADGAAFDVVRAAVNLVLASVLIVIGTTYKLPLSTTYVTFMVAMGTSLADRAWGRESAVFRITGVLSVIGGWFITAGVAFILCFLVTVALFFGSFVAMAVAIALAIFLLVRSNMKYRKHTKEGEADKLFTRIVHCGDKEECWTLLREYVNQTIKDHVRMVTDDYETLTTAFFCEDYRHLKHVTINVDQQRKELKRQRRKQIIALRRLDPIVSVEKSTWYFLIVNSLSQMYYCLKRMGEPCREHVGNNFSPVPSKYANEFLCFRNEIMRLYFRYLDAETTSQIRNDAAELQSSLSEYRIRIIHDIQSKQLNIETMTVFLNVVQESQELLSALRHLMRGEGKMGE